MAIQRYREDTYPESITLLVDDTPLNLDDVQEVFFTYSRFGEEVKILAVKQAPASEGVIIVPFTDAQVGVAGCFDFDIKAVHTDGSKITFMKDDIEFLKDVSK